MKITVWYECPKCDDSNSSDLEMGSEDSKSFLRKRLVYCPECGETYAVTFDAPRVDVTVYTVKFEEKT